MLTVVCVNCDAYQILGLFTLLYKVYSQDKLKAANGVITGKMKLSNKRYSNRNQRFNMQRA